MENDSTKPLSKVIRIDESEIRGHLDKIVRGTVEETLNAMLDEEADQMCQAQRYERSPDRVDNQLGLAEIHECPTARGHGQRDRLLSGLTRPGSLPKGKVRKIFDTTGRERDRGVAERQERRRVVDRWVFAELAHENYALTDLIEKKLWRHCRSARRRIICWPAV